MTAPETAAPQRPPLPTPAARRPRLGFLGVGWIGRSRLNALAAAGLAEIAAVADPDQALAKEAAASVPGAACLASLDNLLRAGLDGVVIATPSALHAEQCLTALAHGLAVFCQKPLGRTAAETRAVVAAARAAGRLLGVDLSYRYVAGVDGLRGLVQAGALGRVYAVHLAFHNAYGPDKDWFYSPRLAGGGCVIDLGIHLVDLALWVLGYPAIEAVHSQLFAHGRRLSGPPEAAGAVEDYAAAQLALAGGVSVQLACSWKLPAGQDCAIEASFYGTEGGASLRNIGGSFYDFEVARLDRTQRAVLAGPPDAWAGRALIAWTQQLAAGSGFDPEAERLVDVAAALDRVYGR